MDEDIPVKKALKYATEPFKKSIGKPKTTWLPTIKSDLERNNMSWENAIEIAKNKKYGTILLKTLHNMTYTTGNIASFIISQ